MAPVRKSIPADPYPFPISGEFDPRRSALLIIDMQRDFCDAQGYMHARGDDIAAARALIPNIAAVRQAAWDSGIKVIYTRQGVRPDLSDLPEDVRLKTALAGAEIGSLGPLGRLLVRGEPGWQIILELAPMAGETVIDKAGTGAFFGTDLYQVLLGSGVRNLILTGVTTGVCVQTTAREAADRGFSVLILDDCCAEPEQNNHAMAVKLLTIEGGYLAARASASDFIRFSQNR